VPAHFDAEVFSAIRRELLNARISLPQAFAALDETQRMVATRHAIVGMLPDALVLRDRFGGHDVFFAILATRLGATLVTADRRFARAAEGYVAVQHVA